MKNRSFIIILSLIIILVLVGAAYWYFFLNVTPAQVTVVPGNQTTTTGFVPINRPLPTGNASTGNSSSTNVTGNNPSNTSSGMPILRQLSSTPIGGFAENTSIPTKTNPIASTTFRWVDRGRGNTYEAYADRLDINILSNTLVPRIYESWWNKSMDTFFAEYGSATNDSLTTVVANIVKVPASAIASAASTSDSTSQQITETAYQLKGTLITGNVIGMAVSPQKDKVIIVMNQNNSAVGYISKFDGTSQSQLFSMPLTQINIDWPETNTIAVTTKGSSSYAGYLYLINAKTGSMKQVIGGIAGLSAKVSRDATKVIYSSTGTGNTAIDTNMLDLKTGKSSPVIFKTLAEKCVWSAKFTSDVYCAVPSQIPTGTYPDDWYIGNVSFNDNIWVLDATTGNANQIANLLTLGKNLIDAYNLQIDDSDSYLLFMNKNDLLLWSLNLLSTH